MTTTRPRIASGLAVPPAPTAPARCADPGIREEILVQAHEIAARAAGPGDDGTNDLLVSQVIRTGELQSWFLAEHLVETPLARV